MISQAWVERIASFGLGVAFTLFTLATCANAEASTVRGNEDMCAAVADVAEGMANWRDAGIEWEVAKPEIEANIAEALKVPESILKDADDAAFAMKISHDVWHAYAKSPPRETAMRVFLDCMKK